MPSGFVICRCDIVYERTLEQLPAHECSAFRCGCGAELGSWNGMLALRYRAIETPSARIRGKARRIGAAQSNTAAA